MSILVIITIQNTKECDNNVSNLLSIFSNPFFIVKKLIIPRCEDDNFVVKKALKYAKEGPYLNDENLIGGFKWNKIPCLIIKDTSIVFISQNNELKNKIFSCINDLDFDLFFLCTWDDNCVKYQNINNFNYLKRTFNPSSTQGIIFTPKSRDYFIEIIENNPEIPIKNILNHNISNNMIKAAAFFPNIIEFDLSLATNNKDFNKFNKCLEYSEKNNNKKIHFLWYFFIIFFIIILAWIYIQSRMY